MKPILTSMLLVAAIGSATLWGADAMTAEMEITEKDVPAAVLKTMQQVAGAAKLGDFESEKKDGKKVFTATFADAAGVEQEVTVAPDGKLIGVEKDDASDKKADDKKPGKKKGKKK